MTTSTGPTVDIGTRAIRLPSGWSVTQAGGIVLCGTHDLKQRVALREAEYQRLGGIPVEGDRANFKGPLFSGDCDEAIIPPPWFERILFGRRPHCRFEWVLQSNAICLIAVYVAELEEDRPQIKLRVAELLNALEIA